MNRKTLIILIATLMLVIIIGVGVYFSFQKKEEQPSTETLFPEGGEVVIKEDLLPKPFEITNETSFFPGTGKQIPRLFELHGVPVAGVGFAEERINGNGTAVRYIERGLGNIFETPLSSLLEVRIGNETRTQIAEAFWGNNGKSVIIRSAKDQGGEIIIKTSILNISKSQSSMSQEGVDSIEEIPSFASLEEVLLPDYIPFAVTAEDGSDKMFYLENGIGVSTGNVTNFKNINTSKVFESPFTEWLPQYPNQNLATVTSKPSGTVPGHFYFINPKTKTSTKILGGINGLTTLTNRDGKFVLYAEVKNGVPELFLYNVVKKEKSQLFLQTLPEKCVWGKKNTTIVYCAVPQNFPRALYPDQWYQGIVSFSDDVWEIDITTKETRKIMTPSDLNAPSLDMINLAVSSLEEYLLFINKSTGTPWIYRITDVVSEPPVASSVNTSIKTIESSPIISEMQKIR